MSTMYYIGMDDISNHGANQNYPVSKIKDSSYLHLSLPLSSLLLFRAPKNSNMER